MRRKLEPGISLLLPLLVLGGTAFGLWGSMETNMARAASSELEGALQQLVDQAQPGDTVRVPAGRYQGPVVVDKPIHLEGSSSGSSTSSDEVVIVNPEKGPVLELRSEGASLTGLTIKDSRNDPDSVALFIRGSGNRISGLHIETMGYGVRLEDANRNLLEELTIQGLTESGEEASQEEEPSERGNGIDLRGSGGNVMKGNTISNMFDGIYIEKGDANRIESNTVTHSRYGYHLMFSKNTLVQDNVGSRNVTGAMIMSDEGSVVTGNDFAKQSENATAQGILLFDVKGSSIENNRVEGNRVGLYAQGITDNRIRNNRFYRNFVGIQMMGAKSNRIEGNEFIANVVQAQATAGEGNRVGFNYWDDHEGLDLQGDGVSDLPYQGNPFFLSLTEQTPAYQIFFGSPGMTLLEGLFQSTEQAVFSDEAPWMKPELPELQQDSTASNSGRAGPLAASAALLGLSTAIFWLGGRRT